MNRSRQYYLFALLLALVFHGSILPFTLGTTYDAYVHMFFGSHYAEGWFETWNYKWYTGFTMTSYPPLVHQVIAMLSWIVGLKGGFIIWALFAIALFIRGIFQFSRLWVSDNAAGYAALAAVFSTSYLEAVHIFGQLPSITGIAFLLNACPELYRWIRYNRWSYFISGLLLISCVTVAHHVTTIFGMVFFVAPTLGLAVLDRCIESRGGIENVRIKDFIQETIRLSPLAILIGISIITITITAIFPYWYWSKTDPINQVSIPHGSRASFIEEPHLGLVFFLIPWGVMLLFLPAIVQKIFHKRNLFLGLSFILLFILGTGGTTPIPKLLLGEGAFNILTLDRFTFWGSIIALPFFGQLSYSMVEGDLSHSIINRFNKIVHLIAIIFVAALILSSAAFVLNFSNFKELQPDPIEMGPIADFMERDGHERWRYLTLGFGDQVAWLGAQTDALSVDGNYHSARRLPELTTRAVERIENSKYLGEEGLRSLRDFISRPDKYNLKYIFSNDKFYEPLLHFYGWVKLKPLENKMEVWERQDILPLPTILPKKEIPQIQRFMWGVIPLSCLTICLLMNIGFWLSRIEDRENLIIDIPEYTSSKSIYLLSTIWLGLLLIICAQKIKGHIDHDPRKNPIDLIQSYFHALDFKKYKDAYAHLASSEDSSYEQFKLELSLEDGVLASYSKLDSINIVATKRISADELEMRIDAHWFTSIQKYKTTHDLKLKNRNGLWYIIKEKYDAQIPPEQFLSIPEIDYLNQGRRKAQINATDQEDILDRPMLYITEANLVRRQGNYSIVGNIINVDNLPAYVSIAGQLYDSNDSLLTIANAGDIMVRNLMPKESTAFRIDFKNAEEIQEKEFDAIEDFAVFAQALVSDQSVYKHFGVRELSTEGNTVHGEIDNYGNKQISIPQLIYSEHASGKLIWCDASYIDSGIRPQRTKSFSINTGTDILFIKQGTDDNLLINNSSRKLFRRFLDNDKLEESTSIFLDQHYVNLYPNGLIVN